jgi:hypothetical protein
VQCAHHGVARKPARARPSCSPKAGHERLCKKTVDRSTEHQERPANQETQAGRSAFSLYAAVRYGADGRQALEQLCHYITRPTLANERVKTNAVGQVVHKLKTAWRDGTTHLMMLPLRSMRRRPEWRLLGIRICKCYGSNGSTAGLRELTRQGVDPSVGNG